MRTRQYKWIRRAANRRRKQIRMRKAFLEGTAAAAFFLLLIGGASLDATPVTGMAMVAICGIYLAVMAVQNGWIK